MNRWTLVETPGATLLHRADHAPIWTVEVIRTLPCSMLHKQRARIAHQVRQDIWRANRRVRGFLPVVEVSTSGDETAIRAGGSLTTRSGHAPTIATAVARVLDDAKNRARWLSHARRAGG